MRGPFYRANRPGAKVSQGVRDTFWLQGMQVGIKGALDCIKAFSETDFTEDLRRFDVPTLIIHGDDDQIVPIGAAALASSQLVKDAKAEHTKRLDGRKYTAMLEKDQPPPLDYRNAGKAKPGE